MQLLLSFDLRRNLNELTDNTQLKKWMAFTFYQFFLILEESVMILIKPSKKIKTSCEKIGCCSILVDGHCGLITAKLMPTEKTIKRADLKNFEENWR